MPPLIRRTMNGIPFRSYDDFSSYLSGLERQGIKPGLERVSRLLHLCGNFHKGLRYIHVAGTNGKGSVCAIVESVLRAAGYRTGLYTSPHLVSYRERIRVNGVSVTEEEVLEDAAALVSPAESMAGEPFGAPSYFEFTTALALRRFAVRRADFVILEVGLGGRLDATNVVSAPFAGITTIGLEHQAQLGNDLFSIAAEKAAIITGGARVTCGEMGEEAFRAIRRRCRQNTATVRRVGDDIIAEILEQSPRGSRIRVTGAFDGPVELFLPLAGRHQAPNCAVACGIVGDIRESGTAVPGPAVQRGVSAVRWRGRLDILSDGPLILADCAHNPAGARAAAKAIGELFPRLRWIVVLGAMRDKGIGEMCNALLPLAAAVVATPVPSERTAPSGVIAGACGARGTARIEETENVSDALRAARRLLREEDAEGILVTGSIYLVGEVMREMNIEND